MNGGITCPAALVKVRTVICDLMLKVIKLGFFSTFSVYSVQSCLVTIEDVHRSIEYVITPPRVSFKISKYIFKTSGSLVTALEYANRASVLRVILGCL